MEQIVKNRIFEEVKKTLKEYGLPFPVSADIYLNQFLDTGLYCSDNSMAKYLQVAYGIKNAELASKLETVILNVIKSEVGD